MLFNDAWSQKGHSASTIARKFCLRCKMRKLAQLVVLQTAVNYFLRNDQFDLMIFDKFDCHFHYVFGH